MAWLFLQYVMVSHLYSMLPSLHSAYAAARPYYEQALEINRKVLGEEHPDMARSLNNLAKLYFYEGNLQEAEDFMNRAVMIFEKILGSQHPDTESVRKNLAFLKQLMRQE